MTQSPSGAGPEAASIDARCAKVPVQLVPMRVPPAGGDAPMVDRLALVGEPVTEVIGRPVLATSDVDIAGVSLVRFGTIARATPTGLGLVDLLIIVVTALMVGFFSFFIAMLALERSDVGAIVPATIAILSMPLAGFASYWFSRRPERVGWTCVVGDQGFQVGTVKGAALDRIVVVYADPTDVWFESTTLGVTKSAGMVMGITRVLAIRAQADLSTIVQCDGSIRPGAVRAPLSELGLARIEAERFIALGEAWERARAVRLELARLDIARGVPLAMPTLDGRRVTIVPHGVDDQGRPRVGLEIARGGTTVLAGGPGAVQVRLNQGTYEIGTSHARETIDRVDLGNPYLLDAYFLGDLGLAIPAQGSLPRQALVPAGLDRR